MFFLNCIIQKLAKADYCYINNALEMEILDGLFTTIVFSMNSVGDIRFPLNTFEGNSQSAMVYV